MNAIGAKIGDRVTIPVDFSSVLGDNSLKNLLALMCFESGGDAFVDFSANKLVLQEHSVPLADLGLQEDEKTLLLDYKIS